MIEKIIRTHLYIVKNGLNDRKVKRLTTKLHIVRNNLNGGIEKQIKIPPQYCKKQCNSHVPTYLFKSFHERFKDKVPTFQAIT